MTGAYIVLNRIVGVNNTFDVISVGLELLAVYSLVNTTKIEN
jgi:hypothetical protein